MTIYDFSLTVWSVTLLLAAAQLVAVVSRAVYNVFYHPLREYPGPLLWRISRLPYVYWSLKGELAFRMLDMHNKHGPVVRIAPDELAFADADAWKDIMTQKSGVLECGKWVAYYTPRDGHPGSIMYAPTEVHAGIRRNMAYGFSERSMREQEAIMQSYINLLIRRLRENCGARGEKPVDLTAWYNFTTFDIIGDLAFGEPFGCLEQSEYHAWVRPIFEVTHMSAVISSVAHYPLVKKLFIKTLSPLLGNKLANHQVYTRNKLLSRMQMDRSDLIEGLIKNREDGEKAMDQLVTNASILVVAGSETTATTLSGVTYYLLTNPDKLKKLVAEVRGAFQKESDITIVSASKLDYMVACLDETMRLYPPVPIGLPRIVPEGGRMICGRYVPADVLPASKTHVSIWHWAMYHNSNHFRDPFSFVPERFMGDPRYESDNRKAHQPFQVGQRDCIGRTLAYAETRLLLSRMIFNFDMELSPESRDWEFGQKAYNLWYKPPLYVHLTPRKLS